MATFSRLRRALAAEEARANALQAALAEFASIRARMDVFAQAQVALFTAGVTAIGVLAGVAIGKDPNLLLLVGIVAPVVLSTHTDLRYRIGQNGAYIGARLWPRVQDLSEPDLPAWEVEWESKMGGKLGEEQFSISS